MPRKSGIPGGRPVSGSTLTCDGTRGGAGAVDCAAAGLTRQATARTTAFTPCARITLDLIVIALNTPPQSTAHGQFTEPPNFSQLALLMALSKRHILPAHVDWRVMPCRLVPPVS